MNIKISKQTARIIISLALVIAVIIGSSFSFSFFDPNPKFLMTASWGAWEDFEEDLKNEWDDARGKNTPEVPFCNEERGDCGLRIGLDKTREVLSTGEFITTDSLVELIVSWTNFALGFLFVIAMSAIIAAGYFWVADFGTDSGKKKAISIITYVIVGILVILVSYAIVMTILKATS